MEKSATSKAAFFFISMCGMIALLFFFLQPKVAASVFPSVREARRTDFLKKVEEAGQINPQDFWQFREFYSPGSFTFNEKYIDVASGLQLKKNVVLPVPRVGLLSFNSVHAQSEESLIVPEAWPSVVTAHHINAQRILFQTPHTYIYTDGAQTKILFMKPISEMMTANGFFLYNDLEKEKFKKYYWLDETTLY